MKTRYKFIHFEPGKGYDMDWTCCNNRDDSLLGTVPLCREGDQEVFVPVGHWVMFSADCLRDIADFMEQLKPAAQAAESEVNSG